MKSVQIPVLQSANNSAVKDKSMSVPLQCLKHTQWYSGRLPWGDKYIN